MKRYPISVAVAVAVAVALAVAVAVDGTVLGACPTACSDGRDGIVVATVDAPINT
jgi:hypothetical protein